MSKLSNKLWISIFAAFLNAAELGYINVIFNLPEDYIVCWIQAVQTRVCEIFISDRISFLARIKKQIQVFFNPDSNG